MTTSDHEQRQGSVYDDIYAQGSRQHVLSDDPLIRYLVRWRLLESMKRLANAMPGLSEESSILVLCSGEGLEGTILADLGYRDVSVSDLSPEGVIAATRRDKRFRASVLNAEATGLVDESYDVVIVQDGLHHLRRPVTGFTEMLRLARGAAVFLEAHDSWSGRTFGREWETNDDATNFVFRWDRRLVDQVAKSYLGPNAFENLSFSFWHHNVHLARLGESVGGGARGRRLVRALKRSLDAMAAGAGNQFCGMVVKRS